jgi:hypothetical protein
VQPASFSDGVDPGQTVHCCRCWQQYFDINLLDEQMLCQHLLITFSIAAPGIMTSKSR